MLNPCVAKNVFEKMTSKRYITFMFKATTNQLKKIYSLTIQLHHVKISAKSNKTSLNYVEFVLKLQTHGATVAHSNQKT